MDPGIIGVFIPIVAIVMGIGIGMLSIWTEHKRKAQLLEQYTRSASPPSRKDCRCRSWTDGWWRSTSTSHPPRPRPIATAS